jgi:hypothetical protein
MVTKQILGQSYDTIDKPKKFPVAHSHGVKVKALPLHAWIGPEGSRNLRFQDFKTIGT